MFTQWDNDEEDEKVDNIIHVLCGRFGSKWRFTRFDWDDKGVLIIKEKCSGSKRAIEEEDPGSDAELVISKKRLKKSSTPDVGDSSSAEDFRDYVDHYCRDMLQQMMDGFRSSEQKMLDGMLLYQQEIQGLSQKVLGIEQSVESLRAAATEQVKSYQQLLLDKTNNAGGETNPAAGIDHNLPCESVNGGGEQSVVMLDEKLPSIDFETVQKKKQEKKTKQVQEKYRERQERVRKLAPTQLSPYQGNNTVKGIIQNKQGAGYDPFSPVDPVKAES